MDFRFTPEQEQFRDSVRRFAEKQLAAGARERAHSPDYPWDVAKLMAAQGLLGITIAEPDGGQGGALIDAVIAIELDPVRDAKTYRSGFGLVENVGGKRLRRHRIGNRMRIAGRLRDGVLSHRDSERGKQP